MSISAIAATAQYGVQQALSRFDKSAQNTVRDTNGGNGDLADDVVDQMTAKQSFDANVKIMKTADNMMGTLLDLKV
jgi:flagellar hook protein FlgE